MSNPLHLEALQSLLDDLKDPEKGKATKAGITGRIEGVMDAWVRDETANDYGVPVEDFDVWPIGTSRKTLEFAAERFAGYHRDNNDEEN